jgi:hypothetical protein
MAKKTGSRDHYVSRLYLRGWALDESEMVWAYTRTPHTEQIRDRRVSTRSIMWEPSLYAYTSEDRRKKSPRGVEPEIGRHIEDKAAPVIEKLRNDQQLSLDERRVFADYVYTQTWRLPHRLSHHQDVSEQVMAMLIARYREEPGSDPGLMDQVEKLLPPAEARDLATGDLVRRSDAREKAIDDLVAMQWIPLRLDFPGILTSDCPVFALPGTGAQVFFMPLCAYRLLMFAPISDQEWSLPVYLACALANRQAIISAKQTVVSGVSLADFDRLWNHIHGFRQILQNSELRPSHPRQ